MDLIKQLGLGFLLEFTDKTSREAKAAGKEIKGLADQVKTLGPEFIKQVDTIEKQMERNRKLVVTGFKMMAGGAAILTPLALAGRAAMQDQHTWTGRVTQAIAQQNITRKEAADLMRREQSVVDSLGNSILGMPMDELDQAFIRLSALLQNSDLAMQSFDQIMKMAAVTNTNATGAVESFNSAYQVFKGNMGDISEQEKVLRITNALAFASQKYGAEVTGIAEGLKFLTEEAGLMNPDLETMLAMMTPLLAMGKPGRMASSAVGSVMTNMLVFDKKVSDTRKALGKPVLSLSDFQQRKDLRESITPELSKLMKVQITDQSGQMRDFPAILADIDRAMGISKEQIAKVDELVAAGKISDEQRMSQLGFSANTQRALIESFGVQIGNFIGKSDAIRRMESEFSNTGYITEAFGAVTDDATFQVQILKNQFMNLAEDIGYNLLPTIKEFSKEIRPWLEDLTEFAKNNPNFVKNTLLGAGATGLALEGGGMALAAGGAAANTYLGYKTWRMMREMKLEAAKAASGAVDDAATAAAKQAAAQIDDAAKQVTKTVASSVDDAFFSEFATAKDVSRNILGEAVPLIDDAAVAAVREVEKGAARTIASMLVKGGAGTLKGFLGLGLGTLIPTGFESKTYAPTLSDIGGRSQNNIAWNRLATGMFDPMQDHRIATMMDPSARMAESMKALVQVMFGEDSPMRAAATAQGAPVQQSFGNIYIVTPQGSNPVDYVKAFDEYIADKADRAAGAKH